LQDAIITDNRLSHVWESNVVNGMTYITTLAGWRVSPSGTVFFPVHRGFPLYYTKQDNGIMLYDAHFSQILQGDSIDIHTDRCIIHSRSRQPLTIDYLDYLRFGMQQ